MPCRNGCVQTIGLDHKERPQWERSLYLGAKRKAFREGRGCELSSEWSSLLGSEQAGERVLCVDGDVGRPFGDTGSRSRQSSSGRRF